MASRIALTRPISASFVQCELTYLERTPIDLDEARRQHASYEALLGSLGWEIVRLPVLDDQPDAVFVEDAAIALEELAVVAPMGAALNFAESSVAFTADVASFASASGESSQRLESLSLPPERASSRAFSINFS